MRLPFSTERPRPQKRSNPDRARRARARARLAFGPTLDHLEPRQLLTVGAFLQGTAYDPNHLPLPGATIELFAVNGNTQTQTQIGQATTDSNGNYYFDDHNNLFSGQSLVAPDTYQIVEVAPAGFQLSGAQTQAVAPPDTATVLPSNAIQVTIADPTQLTYTLNGFENPFAEVIDELNGFFRDSDLAAQFYISLTDSNPNPPQTSGNINTYCVQLDADLNFATYQVTPEPAQTALPNGGQIAYLYNHYGTVDLTMTVPAALVQELNQLNQEPGAGPLEAGVNADISGGLQIAIWQLEYGSAAFQFLGVNSGHASPQDLADIQASETWFLDDAAGHSEQAMVLAVNSLGQSLLAPLSLDFTNTATTQTQATPTIVTTPNATAITLGTTPTTLKDTADLEGGSSPTGTITFTLFQGTTPVDTETVPVSGNGSYTTPVGYTPPTTGAATGPYQWDATYSGDSNNKTVSENGMAAEQVTVSPATPAINTVAGPAVVLGGGTKLTDTAALSGGFNPTGTITFTLTGPGNAVVDTETVSVTGDKSYTTPAGFLPTAAGTYTWSAAYSGDANNIKANDNGQNETETVSPATPAINTTPSPSTVTLGTSTVTLKDTAVLSGGFGATGTITFTLFQGTTLVDTETVTVSGNGPYTTPTGYTLPTTGTVTGKYQWDATYSGDSNNKTVSENGMAAEQVTVSPATPALTTQASETAGGVVGTALLSDSATLSGGFNPTGTITFTLTMPDGTVLPEGSVVVNGDNTYPSPSVLATQVGTYTWHAVYSSDANNVSVQDNGANEGVITVKATPAINTVAGGTVIIGSGAKLTDTANLSGGFSPTGTVTFYLFAPGVTPNATDTNNVYADTVPVNGDGTYTTAAGANPGGYVPTATGTFQWVAVYSGDANNISVHDNGQNESETDSPATPTIATTPSMTTTTTSGGVVSGQFATIGFWHNQNGQAVINSFNGGPSQTQLGNWLATNFPHLFGASNPYNATSLAGLTNAQVAAAYLNLWTPSGLQKNTYVQAFAVALGLYADTTSLGGQSLLNNGLAAQYGFVVTASGAGTFGVGGNGSAFGVSNGTSVSVLQILQAADGNFTPSTGLFYGGNQNNTSAANNVLDGINSVGDIPGTSSVLTTTGVSKLNDSATLTGGVNPTGTVTFYLFAPGVTPNVADSNNVYADTVTVNGDGTYTTAAGSNPGGYVPVATGTYQWVAVYSGDAKNNGVNSPFGSEPWTVGAAGPTINTIDGGAVVLGSGAKLTDSAMLAAGVNPTGTVTFYLFAPGVTPNANNSNNVYADTVTVNGNGTYSTAAGTNPGGYLPTMAGTYQWVAVYSGDAKNNAVASPFGDEPETAGSSTPAISTVAGGTVVLDSFVLLSDTATLSGGVNPTGTITFTLTGPGNTVVDTETVTVSGDGSYATPTGYLPTATGTYTWSATYSGDANNISVHDNGQNETETVSTGTKVVSGQFATIGFWHNKNGQAVITSLNSGPNDTQLGNWLASNFPHLFGASNPYISSTLASFPGHPTSLAGLTNAQIAAVYLGLWTPSGVTKNTYVQAFAVALGMFSTTSSLGGASLVSNGMAAKFGFKVSAAGGSGAVYNISGNTSAFSGQTGSPTVFQILTIVDANFDPTTGNFYGGDQSKTSAANNVLNGINTTGDIS